MVNENYGDLLAEKIRANANLSKLTDYEKFVIDRGFEFGTEASLKAGYDRLWKSRRGILISKDEFLAEANKPEDGAAAETYDVLANLVETGKISAEDVYRYARFKWCLNDPDAIVSYQYGRDKWAVNNCEEKINGDVARIMVCEEWGFEASRIKIIGTPYYDATDWQFIRFDCALVSWLWRNGDLHQVSDNPCRRPGGDRPRPGRQAA